MFSLDEKDRLRPIVTSPNCFGTVLHAIALKAFGNEIYEWEPEMIELEFRDELDVDLPQINQDKLISIISAIGDGAFYVDSRTFMVTCETLSGTLADFETMSPEDLTAAEAAWGVVEIAINDPTDDDFDQDVGALVGVVLAEEGIDRPVPPLGFAITRGGEGELSRNWDAVENYLASQSDMLMAQIEKLPWADGEMVGHLNREIDSLNLERRSVPHSV